MSERGFSVPGTFLLGFGFLGVSAVWAAYNAYVPVLLKSGFGLSSTLIGGVMTIDNVLAVLLLPFLGALSDRTSSRLGRRRPYILAGSTLAFAFCVVLPHAALHRALGATMLTVVLLNLSMASFRSPVIALMPDVTPSRFRSQANGVINFMGGLGALMVYFGGKPLHDRNVSLPFLAAGSVMFGASMLVVLFVREPREAPRAPSAVSEAPASVIRREGETSLAASFRELRENLKDVFAGEKSLLFMLLATFFWFAGFNAIETFFTSYGRYHLGVEESTAALILGFFSVTFMASSVASGFLASRVGRRPTVMAGIAVVTAVLTSSLFLRGFGALAAVFAAGGLGWALINVNSLPMVVDMTRDAKAGGYTGLYYFFSQAASVAAPPAAGALIDLFGYPALMAFAAAMFALSFFLMALVRRGEAV